MRARPSPLDEETGSHSIPGDHNSAPAAVFLTQALQSPSSLCEYSPPWEGCGRLCGLTLAQQAGGCDFKSPRRLPILAIAQQPRHLRRPWGQQLERRPTPTSAHTSGSRSSRVRLLFAPRGEGRRTRPRSLGSWERRLGPRILRETEEEAPAATDSSGRMSSRLSTQIPG